VSRRAPSSSGGAPPRNSRVAPARPSSPSTAAPRPPRRTPRELLAALRLRAQVLGARLERPAKLLGRVLVVLACTGGSIAVARLVERHVRTSPAFGTRTISVDGLERLTRAEVLAASGLRPGQNSFEVSPEQAEERLRDHPWIVAAHVERRLPGTFLVHVRERHAVAVLALGALYLVAEDGAVFKRVGPDDPVDLPVITGVERERFTSDLAYRTSLLLEVVALLHDWRGAGLVARAPIGEVHVESNGGLSLYVGDDALYARLGRAPFREKLARFRGVLDRLAQEHQKAAYVYLDNVRHPDRVTVRLVGDPVADPRAVIALHSAP
jgi:cell division protein FtsQ